MTLVHGHTFWCFAGLRIYFAWTVSIHLHTYYSTTHGSNTILVMYSLGILGSWWEKTFFSPTSQIRCWSGGFSFKLLCSIWNFSTPLRSSSLGNWSLDTCSLKKPACLQNDSIHAAYQVLNYRLNQHVSHEIRHLPGLAWHGYYHDEVMNSAFVVSAWNGHCNAHVCCLLSEMF